MSAVLEHFPGAQRALFRRYHIGGCSSCGSHLFPHGKPAQNVLRIEHENGPAKCRPDEMAHEVENAVQAGSFENAAEVVRASLREFFPPPV